jgi:hypothetical protein
MDIKILKLFYKILYTRYGPTSWSHLNHVALHSHFNNIKIYTLYYDHFYIWLFWLIQIWISRIYKEKSIFETLDGFKLFLFLSNATPKNYCNRPKMVAINIMPGNRTILNCHDCHVTGSHLEDVLMWSHLRMWWCDPINSNEICMRRQEKIKKIKIVSITVWTMQPLFQQSTLTTTLHKILCFSFHPTFLNLVLPPANHGRA